MEDQDEFDYDEILSLPNSSNGVGIFVKTIASFSLLRSFALSSTCFQYSSHPLKDEFAMIYARSCGLKPDRISYNGLASTSKRLPY